MTTTPTPPAGPDQQPDSVDGECARIALSSGEYLAGHLAAAMLHPNPGTSRRPDTGRLPHLLFPNVDPEVRDRIWQEAVMVGFRAAQLAAAPRLHRNTLANLQELLEGAGYAAMGRLVHATRTVHTAAPPEHPADAAGAVRGDHW